MFLLLFKFLLIQIIVLIQCSNCDGMNEILNITDLNYQKWIRPFYNDRKVIVSVGMQMDRFAFYNDIESILQIQALFNFQWQDPRLKFNCSRNLIEGNHYYQKIWIPNLQVYHSKDIDVFSSQTLSKLISLRIDCNGEVHIRIRSNLNLIWVMNYQKYPFDNQTCQFKLISNDLTSNDLILKWNEILIENFYISGHLLENYASIEHFEMIRNENFSTLVVELNLKRQFIHYMLVLFLPSILIVATSWIAFWIDITSIPSRIALCVTTLLAMVTVSKESKQEIPKVSYIKAVDLWFAGCTTSIFLSFIEYVFVCYVYREERNKLKTKKRIKRSLSAISFSSFDEHSFKDNNSSIFLSPKDTTTSNHLGRRYSSNCIPITRNISFLNQFGLKLQSTSNPGESSSNQQIISTTEINNNNLCIKDTPQEVAESIDRKCRYLFPLAFTFFNLIYWTYL